MSALVSCGYQPVVVQLEEALGRKIRLLRQVSRAEQPSSEELHAVVEQIRATPSDKVLLGISGSRVEMYPYQ